MRFERDIPVRWSDLDALGHVNNLAFLDYVQEARIDALEQLGVHLEGPSDGPVVVNIQCNYRRVLHHPATVRVDTELTVASPRRLLMRHRLLDAHQLDVLYADAEVTVVWLDLSSGRSTGLPESLLHQLSGKPGD